MPARTHAVPMTRRSPALPLAGFGLLAAGVYATAAVLVDSPLFAEAPELGAAAVTFDLVVTVPFFFWLLVIRPRRLPWISIVPCFLLSLLAASFVLPDERQRYLATARMLVAPAELALAGYAGARVYRLFRRGAAEGRDVLADVRSVTREVIPVRAAADVVAGEVALAWYALLAWRARPEVAPGETAYASHRKSGLGGVIGALALACAGEAAGVHLLVEQWSPAAAWALTALSVYGILWLVGLGRSVALRPTVLSADGLRVRVGLLWEMAIPFGCIAAVTAGASGTPRRAPGHLHAALFATPRLVIELAEPMEAVGLYGQRRRGIERIALYVDQPNELAAELGARMGIPTA